MDKVNTDLNKFVFIKITKIWWLVKKNYSYAMLPTLPTIHILYSIAPCLKWTQTQNSLCSNIDKTSCKYAWWSWEVGGANFRSVWVIKKKFYNIFTLLLTLLFSFEFCFAFLCWFDFILLFCDISITQDKIYPPGQGFRVYLSRFLSFFISVWCTFLFCYNIHIHFSLLFHSNVFFLFISFHIKIITHINK